MEWHEMQDAKYHQMTETPIPGLIARLAVPTICSMLITSIYNMADTYFVSQLGTDASAAVGRESSRRPANRFPPPSSPRLRSAP